MEIAIYILGLVIVTQAAERYFYSKHMVTMLDNAHKLNNSKSPSDYAVLKAADTIKKEEFKQPDEVSLEEASDDVFDKHIESLS